MKPQFLSTCNLPLWPLPTPFHATPSLIWLLILTEPLPKLRSPSPTDMTLLHYFWSLNK